MKIPRYFFATVLTLVMWGCQSTPPPEPQPDVPPVTNPDTPPANDGLSALSEAEVKKVEDAIAAAEAADAAQFAPDLLQKAKSDLDQAKKLGSTGNPGEARPLLATALKAAEDALAQSRKTLADSWKNRLTTAQNRFASLKGPQFYPEDGAALAKAAAEANAALDSDPVNGKALAQKVMEDYTRLIEKLESEVAQVIRLQQDTTEKLAQAEELEAYIWMPEVLEEANDEFFRGNDSYKRYNLSEALDAYTQAKFLATKAVNETRIRKAAKETEDLMIETMRKIERASNLIIVDENDEVVDPEPWDGSQFLNKPKDQPAPGPQSYRLPQDGTTVVLEEVSRASYLTLAKELWYKGVAEKDQGNFPVANQFFLESQKYIALYESLAVDKLYTVRLIPERRDALWRIAEYSDIYGDPLKWPLIWKRNRKLIQNPDLIFPGWQLIIPPQ